jgi:hypothetical protein
MKAGLERGVSIDTVGSIWAPDRVESRLGRSEFHAGAQSEATAELLYDHLDVVHGVEAFINIMPGASLTAQRQGLLYKGVEDNRLGPPGA